MRETLKRLYQKGFVTLLPRRGFYAVEIDEDEASELYELREVLELYTLRRSRHEVSSRRTCGGLMDSIEPRRIWCAMARRASA